MIVLAIARTKTLYRLFRTSALGTLAFSAFMPVDDQHCREVFTKLGRELTSIAKHSGADAVHKLRTSTRRVETVIEEVVPEPDRSTRKLIKSLRRLRKKAGKVRDLDVHIAALKNLKIARETEQKSQLLRTLTIERLKKEKKLTAALSKEEVRKLRRRLKRACASLDIPQGLEPLDLALRSLAEISAGNSPLNQKTVHEYRIAGKRARYLIELGGKDAKAEAVNENLKKMQDVVGDWHDWLTLSTRAEELFGGVKDSALVAAMRNLTRAKFRESVDAISRMRKLLASEDSAASPAAREFRKPVTSTQNVSAAA